MVDSSPWKPILKQRQNRLWIVALLVEMCNKLTPQETKRQSHHQLVKCEVSTKQLTCWYVLADNIYAYSHYDTLEHENVNLYIPKNPL